MKIGIVGGSLAGCSAAILMLRAGHDVTVFERSDKPLVGRGGGIGTTTDMITRLKADNVIDADFRSLHATRMPLVGKTPASEPFGRTAWSISLDFQVFQWNELWSRLRLNVPDACYRAGLQITGAVMLNENTVQLAGADGSKHEFDLVLFADGYNSLGRRILFPEAKLKYRGYVLWRGLLEENDVPGDCPLRDEILRLSYNGQPGHNVVYYIPGKDRSVRPGERVFNWAAYIAIPPAELDALMTDRNGRVRTGTLPPGRMSPDNESKLKSYLAQHIPAFYADIVQRTSDSYIQVIYTLDLDDYYGDRMCLIGDAGMVIQPFTGSGVFKGYTNASDLLQSLGMHSSIADGLAEWSRKQVGTGKRLLALGEQMEKAFIWEQPDFGVLDPAETERWWKASVTFPEDFSYEKS